MRNLSLALAAAAIMLIAAPTVAVKPAYAAPALSQEEAAADLSSDTVGTITTGRTAARSSSTGRAERLCIAAAVGRMCIIVITGRIDTGATITIGHIGTTAITEQ